MQTYSTVKSKSNSDDGNVTLPEHTVLERSTFSDDGFDSFPEYNRIAAEDSDPGSDCESEHASEDQYESFYSCDSHIQNYEDAQSHQSGSENRELPPAVENTGIASPQKKKRRRPKKKNKANKEKGPEADSGLVGDGCEGGLQASSESQKQKNDMSKGKCKMEEVNKEAESAGLSPEQPVTATGLFRLWKASGL